MFFPLGIALAVASIASIRADGWNLTAVVLGLLAIFIWVMIVMALKDLSKKRQ